MTTATAKYDASLLSLAKQVGAKLYRYGEAEIGQIAEWLVEAGGDTGKPVAWIAAQYRVGHLAAQR